jgi:O2-independent ubiquinone biosynthesis accessory factor UbiT
MLLSSPRSLLPKLPLSLIRPVRYMPFGLQSLVLKKVLRKAFKSALEQGDIEFLKQRWLKIDITDAGIIWFFSCGPGNEILMHKNAQTDVCIRGNLNSFILLAAQKEDPDTLFFQRDLVIEGDTDLGLEIKNLMDSLDLDDLPPELLFAVRSAAEYVSVFN